MKILVVSSNRHRFPWPVPPLGACYIASSLKSAGHRIKFLDLLFSQNPAFDITQAVRKFNPQLIAVAIRNIDNADQQEPESYVPAVKETIINTIRKHTSSPIVIGGAAVNIIPKRFLEYLNADFAIFGDGEKGITELVQALSVKSGLSNVPGLIYRQDSQKIIQNPPARISNLDDLPLPKVYQWIDWKRYQDNYGSVPVQTKRGCSLKCTYCVYNKIEGAQYRLRKPERVAEEIEDIVGHCHPRMIEFVDSTFNIPLDYAKSICQEIIKRKIPTTFNTMGINPGSVTAELIQLMEKANFKEFSCTPETGSSRMLKSLGKNFSLNEVKQAISLFKTTKIPVIWYFLFGGPGENPDTVEETLNFIEKNIPKKDLVFLTSGIRILPGAPIHQAAIENSQINPDTDMLFPVFYQPKEINKQALFYLINKAVIKHPNFMTMRSNEEDNFLARTVKRLYGKFNIEEPLWVNLMRRDILYRITGYNRYRLWKLEKEYKESLQK